MKDSDAAVVLALCASFDRRTVGRTDAAAWGRVLTDVTLEDACAAVDAWYSERRDWIMPADVLSGARALARRRAALERQAELERQIAEENPGVDPKAVLNPQPGQLSGGPAQEVAAALVPVKDVPRRDRKRPAELLRQSFAEAQRQAAGTAEEREAAFAAAKADHDVALAAALAEVRQVEAARREQEPSEVADA